MASGMQAKLAEQVRDCALHEQRRTRQQRTVKALRGSVGGNAVEFIDQPTASNTGTYYVMAGLHTLAMLDYDYQGKYVQFVLTPVTAELAAESGMGSGRPISPYNGYEKPFRGRKTMIRMLYYGDGPALAMFLDLWAAAVGARHAELSACAAPAEEAAG